MNIKINLLHEEVNEKDSKIKGLSIKVEQLQKQNKNLQNLVNKYKKWEYTETTSMSTPTDEVLLYVDMTNEKCINDFT